MWQLFPKAADFKEGTRPKSHWSERIMRDTKSCNCEKEMSFFSANKTRFSWVWKCHDLTFLLYYCCSVHVFCSHNFLNFGNLFKRPLFLLYRKVLTNHFLVCLSLSFITVQFTRWLGLCLVLSKHKSVIDLFKQKVWHLFLLLFWQQRLLLYKRHFVYLLVCPYKSFFLPICKLVTSWRVLEDLFRSPTLFFDREKC